MEIQDGSNDKKYFTIIPNYILNHSTMWDREVYVQMKRIAGEQGTCWTSRKTLATQCGMSPRRLDKSIDYLLEHKWIKQVGTKRVGTAGGTQQVNEYKVTDLWDLNNNYYKDKGVAPETIPYDKGIARIEQRGSTDEAKGIAHGATKEEPLLRRTIKEEDILLNLLSDKDSLLREKTNEPINKDYEHFLIWYKFYPRKVGKPNAYKAWRRLKPDTELKRKMVTMVLEHSKSKQWQSPDFIPYPATWINQERWNDTLPQDNEEEK